MEKPTDMNTCCGNDDDDDGKFLSYVFIQNVATKFAKAF